MDAACKRSGRSPDSVQLICVSKFHPQEAVIEAIKSGAHIFGENRVQEACGKFADIKDQALKLHLIGPLQTNKVKQACGMFDMIQTLDRPSLSDALLKQLEQVGHIPDLLVQVNIGNEPQKAGVLVKDADNFIEQSLKQFPGKIKGLMAIPPHDETPDPYFEKLAQIASRHGLTELSMGMSADFEKAIEAGSTMVRVGSALFGPRPTSF